MCDRSIIDITKTKVMFTESYTALDQPQRVDKIAFWLCCSCSSTDDLSLPSYYIPPASSYTIHVGARSLRITMLFTAYLLRN
jgi:hypothetical protein